MRDFDRTLVGEFTLDTTPKGHRAEAPLEQRWGNAVREFNKARQVADAAEANLLDEARKSTPTIATDQETPKSSSAQWNTFAAFVGVTCLIGLGLLSWLVVHATLVSRDHLRSSLDAEDRAGFARLALARLALSGPAAADQALDLIALTRRQPQQSPDDDE